MSVRKRKQKPTLKPESEWTADDRGFKSSIETFHGGTWMPTADGGLTRVSKHGRYGQARKRLAPLVPMSIFSSNPREMMQDLLAIRGR